MKKLITILLLTVTTASAQVGPTNPQMTETGLAFTCQTIVPILGKTMVGCDPTTGSISTVSPTGIVSGSTAPTPIAVTNGPNASVAQVEQTLLALPSIIPLQGRGVQVHAFVGHAKLTSPGFQTFRILRNGSEILKAAHRCGGGLGESCHWAVSLLDAGAVAGVPTTYELRWVTSAGFARSDSASNGYERRQLWVVP